MIPYWYYPEIHLGITTVKTWGLLASTGFILSIVIAYRQASRLNLDKETAIEIAFGIVIFSIIGARLGEIFFYRSNLFYYIKHPIEMVITWKGGFSSYGGFLGTAFVFIWFYYKLKKEKFFWQYVDIFSFAFVPGWMIGRTGCFLVHDHPGRLTSFFLAVPYPDGIRHDLGLYEILAMLPLLLFFLIGYKKIIKKTGFIFYCLIGYYPIIRFFLDFLRAVDLSSSDIRFMSLTPAQYGCIILIIMLFYIKHKVKQ